MACASRGVAALAAQRRADSRSRGREAALADKAATAWRRLK